MKRYLSIALCLLFTLVLTVGVQAAENVCEHSSWTVTNIEVGESYEAGCELRQDTVYTTVCNGCLDIRTYTYTEVLEVYEHIMDYEFYCDGSFWYERYYCTRCYYTEEYESGANCGCGRH
ncbi:MAG: hypothetical protein IJ493_06525 [Clostridia bacterium]|nr:hypothetical protein [Clostridia bacterium]